MQSVEKILGVLDEIPSAYKDIKEVISNQKDLIEVQNFRKQAEGTDEIKPWDFAYYSEKLKEQKYSLVDQFCT